jgi:hypothetical protein
MTAQELETIRVATGWIATLSVAWLACLAVVMWTWRRERS